MASGGDPERGPRAGPPVSAIARPALPAAGAFGRGGGTGPSGDRCAHGALEEQACPGRGFPHARTMFIVSKAEAAAIRTAHAEGGELSAAVALRRLFPGITENAKARD
jgi:hypothetical protein